MLVFARRCYQGFVIGDDVLVTVLEGQGSYTRLGIKAPPEIPIHRQEVYGRVRDENGGLPLYPGKRDQEIVKLRAEIAELRCRMLDLARGA